MRRRRSPGTAIPAIGRQIAEHEARLTSRPVSGCSRRRSTRKTSPQVTRWTHIPVSKLMEGEIQKLLQMEARLHDRVIGQDEAMNAVANAIRRARAGLQDADRPLGSFLFLGPTGVGKTELARALADFLFDDEHAMVRVDMSEYREKHSVARMIGAPPGYVGYEEAASSPSGAPASVLGRAAGRGREGASGGAQRPAPAPGRWPADRWQGSDGRLPADGRDHESNIGSHVIAEFAHRDGTLEEGGAGR